MSFLVILIFSLLLSIIVTLVFRSRNFSNSFDYFEIDQTDSLFFFVRVYIVLTYSFIVMTKVSIIFFLYLYYICWIKVFNISNILLAS